MVWLRHKTPPLKAMSQKPTEKISQIQEREAGHPRNGSLSEKTQGFLLLPQGAEHRTLVIGIQLAVWRERGIFLLVESMCYWCNMFRKITIRILSVKYVQYVRYHVRCTPS